MPSFWARGCGCATRPFVGTHRKAADARDTAAIDLPSPQKAVKEAAADGSRNGENDTRTLPAVSVPDSPTEETSSKPIEVEGNGNEEEVKTPSTQAEDASPIAEDQHREELEHAEEYQADSRAASDRASEEVPEERIVKLHIYHTDPYTAFLNRAGLKYAEVPVYHCGIEVYGVEWAFTYFDDCWDNDTTTGVWPAQQPMQMEGFDYQETISVGPTQLDAYEVQQITQRLRREWPACSYHLTRHNCLTFAKQFVEELRVPEEFPKMLLGFSDCPQYLPKIDAVANFGWSWYKWSMTRNLNLPPPDNDEVEAPAGNWLTSCCASPQVVS